jgi:5-bromo-4-chloroindolyl phosphate hydrolysis protein
MSPDQFQLSKKINFSPTGIAMIIFSIVLGVLVILPILLLLLVAGVVAMTAFGFLSVCARVANTFRGFTKKDSEGRKNVRIRQSPPDHQ